MSRELDGNKSFFKSEEDKNYMTHDKGRVASNVLVKAYVSNQVVLSDFESGSTILLGASGAASTTDNQEVIDKMHTFGEKIGIAFQIRDDLFDFGDGDAGKPQGNDIQEKKMTLPLIHALNKTTKKQRDYIINIVKNENTNPKKIREVTEFVLASPGIEYARQMMYKYRSEAFEILKTFPASDARESLEDLVNYVTERKK